MQVGRPRVYLAGSIIIHGPNSGHRNVEYKTQIFLPQISLLSKGDGKSGFFFFLCTQVLYRRENHYLSGSTGIPTSGRKMEEKPKEGGCLKGS